MEKSTHWDVALWSVHVTEEDCQLIIRTNNGYAFYCRIDPPNCHRSPKFAEQYFKCLNLLRFGEEEQDDFYLDEALDWLSKPFEPFITQLAPSSLVLPEHERPALSRYLFPPHYVYDLDVTDEVPRAYLAESQETGHSEQSILMRGEFARDIDQWAQFYHPSDIEIVYDHLKDILIKPPKKVLVDAGKPGETACFFKPFRLGLGKEHAKKELITLRDIVRAQIPHDPEARVCRLHGVVRDGNKLLGMLFPWIDTKGILSKARAAQSPPNVRKRWKGQISTTIEKLHDKGIVWGDAKADNVLIDKDDNAWVVDFGGSYTPGWVDKEKAGTLEGDAQGLAKILDILQ